MSFMSLSTSSVDCDRAEVSYRPKRANGYGDGWIPASVDVQLTGKGSAWLNLSIDDAWHVLAAMPKVLAEHAEAQRDFALAETLETIAELIASLPGSTTDTGDAKAAA